jgi:hypothetical protein
LLGDKDHYFWERFSGNGPYGLEDIFACIARTSALGTPFFSLFLARDEFSTQLYPMPWYTTVVSGKFRSLQEPRHRYKIAKKNVDIAQTAF